jgi:hypothetical protein
MQHSKRLPEWEQIPLLCLAQLQRQNLLRMMSLLQISPIRASCSCPMVERQLNLSLQLNRLLNLSP